MVDIFKVKHEKYDKKGASTIVLKVKSYQSLKEKIQKEIDEGSKSKKKLAKKRELEEKITKEKVRLFQKMSKVVIKNINNYLKLAYNSPVYEKCNNKYEMQSEAWIMLDKCIDKFKLNKNYCFYFYYNKSMSRVFYRMFIKTVQKKERKEEFTTEQLKTSSNCSLNNSNFSVEMVVNNLDLTDIEEKILFSKLKKQKKDDFLEENDNISSGKYYENLKKLKNKFLKMKENGEI